MTITKAPGAQFEISIDGTPRTYRDRKALAPSRPPDISSASIRTVPSWSTAVEYKPELGPR
jgi:hypothetical protein